MTWTDEKEVVLESGIISSINIVQIKIYIVSNQLKKLYYYDLNMQVIDSRKLNTIDKLVGAFDKAGNMLIASTQRNINQRILTLHVYEETGKRHELNVERLSLESDVPVAVVVNDRNQQVLVPTHVLVCYTYLQYCIFRNNIISH